MDVKMETVLAVIGAIFVLFTAMIDTRASFVVALVAIVYVLGYMVLSPKPKKVSSKQSKSSKAKKSVSKSKK